MKAHLIRVSLLSLAIAGIACSQESKEASPVTDSKEAPAKAAGPRVALDTSLGTIVIELNEEKAPLSSKNFLAYVKDGYYDGTLFHRVIGTFMIQGGGFELKDGVGTQKTTKEPIKNEASNGLKNLRGTVAMARTNDPHSATSQFFINVVDNAGLNPGGFSPDGYAVFGKVVEGMDVVDKIKAVETGGKQLKALHPVTKKHVAQPMSDVPLKDVVIKSAQLIEQK
jgi:cyclophilin family peptidyl-prolyl cis-trans isomerase